MPLAALDAMQFGHALDRILREIILADPSLGPVQLLKLDLSDALYQVNLNVADIPKLGVVFPTKRGDPQLVAFPLVLPMGWKNSPPVFSTATETIADLANQRIRSGSTPLPHALDDMAEAAKAECPLGGARPPARGAHLPSPPRGPSLPSASAPASYVDVFVDDL